jgi:hypothetical protein
VPINEGDRVQTKRLLNGMVGLLSDDGTLAYVQLDGSKCGPLLTLYDAAELTKICEEVAEATPDLHRF